MQRIVYNIFLKWAVASQVDQWKVLSASGLDFTMVMPPMLLNSSGRGTYRIDGEALPRFGARIAREDVADFMMEQVEGKEWVGRGGLHRMVSGGCVARTDGDAGGGPGLEPGESAEGAVAREVGNVEQMAGGDGRRVLHPIGAVRGALVGRGPADGEVSGFDLP